MYCPGCFVEKSSAVVCPQCGYDESLKRSPLMLPHHAELNQGRYRVGRVLGKPGGFGITYLGWDQRLLTKVAIKEYLPRDLAGREVDHQTIVAHSGEDADTFTYGLGKFLEEARTLAQLDHPNIVRIRDFFEENGTAYLVMDYYDGLTLSDYLSRQPGGKLTEDQALSVLMPILDGLREVHAKGFLHRDIKPQNIYLTTGNRPILLDFGAARQAMGERSRSLSVVLSEGYAPIEQYQRNGKQGPWTDVYGAAATLYTMISGEVPPSATDRIGANGNLNLGAMNISPRMMLALDKGLCPEVSGRIQFIPAWQAIWLNEPRKERVESNRKDIDETYQTEQQKASDAPENVAQPAPDSLKMSAGQAPRIEFERLYSLAVNEKPGGYYIEQFKKFDCYPDRKFSFNWSAFLLGPFWLFYRGLWLPLLTWLALQFLVVDEHSHVGTALSLGFSIYIAGFGTNLFYKKISRIVSVVLRSSNDYSAIEKLISRRRKIDSYIRFGSLLVPCLLVVFYTLLDRHSPIHEAEIAYKNGQYERAREILHPLAESGYTEAQTQLGIMYEDGRGVTKNEVEAIKWYQKAADQGLAAAQYNLGLMYKQGRGVVQNDSAAVKWYKKAADQGYVWGQLNLGLMYAEGRGVTKDEVEAVKWFRKAADQGYALGQSNLAQMYALGRGVTKDEVEAVKWFRRAADQGYARAQIFLGFMYEEGRGVTRNEVEAINWYHKAAEQGDEGAKQDLIRLKVVQTK